MKDRVGDSPFNLALSLHLNLFPVFMEEKAYGDITHSKATLRISPMISQC